MKFKTTHGLQEVDRPDKKLANKRTSEKKKYTYEIYFLKQNSLPSILMTYGLVDAYSKLATKPSPWEMNSQQVKRCNFHRTKTIPTVLFFIVCVQSNFILTQNKSHQNLVLICRTVNPCYCTVLLASLHQSLAFSLPRLGNLPKKEILPLEYYAEIKTHKSTQLKRQDTKIQTCTKHQSAVLVGSPYSLHISITLLTDHGHSFVFIFLTYVLWCTHM